MKKVLLVTVLALLYACTPVTKEIPPSNETQIGDVETSTEIEVPVTDQTDTQAEPEEKENAGVQPISIELDNIDGYEEIGVLANGGIVYFKSAGFYNKLEFGERIVVKKNEMYYLLSEGSPSKPIIGPTGDTVAYIDSIQFESKGNLFIYNSQTDRIKRFTDYVYGSTPQDTNTVKDCLWLNESEMLVIIGFDTGTITQGGDVYLINLEDKSLSLKYKAKKNEEVAKLTMDQEDVIFNIVYWTDDNFMNYEYKEERYTPDQILGM